jgi:hypothetical protein
MPLQIVIIYPSFNTMNFKNIVTLGAISTATLTMIGSSFITPVPAQAATAQDFVNMFDVLKRYVIDLDKTMRSGDAAIPTPQPDDIPTPDDIEEVESN